MFDGKAKIIRCQILPIPLHPQHAGQIDTDEQPGTNKLLDSEYFQLVPRLSVCLFLRDEENSD